MEIATHKIDTHIRFRDALSKSIQRVLFNLKDHSVIINDVERALTPKENLHNAITYLDDYFIVKIHTEKIELPNLKLDNTIVQSWDEINDKKVRSLFEQSEIELNGKIEAYFSCNRCKQKKLKAQSFSHFKNQFHKKDTSGLLYNVYKFGIEFDQEKSIIEVL